MHTFRPPRPRPAAAGGHFKNVTCVHLHIRDWKALVWGLHRLQSQIGGPQCCKTTCNAARQQVPLGKFWVSLCLSFPTRKMRMMALSPSAWLWELYSHTELSVCRYSYKIFCYFPSNCSDTRHCGETAAPRVGDTCLESQNKGLSASKFILRIMKDLRVQKGAWSPGTQIFLFNVSFLVLFF